MRHGQSKQELRNEIALLRNALKTIAEYPLPVREFPVTTGDKRYVALENAEFLREMARDALNGEAP